MNIADLAGKQVAILGYGREGEAMHAALKKLAPSATVTIRDKKDGDNYLEDLDQFDVLIKSPGIPPAQIPQTSATLTNSTQIFLDSIDPRATVIGITGSKGKSTTASLLHHILKEAGKKTILLGNIGEPAIAHIEDIDEHTLVVLEVSSYQLMQLNRSPQIAVITSFFPEHLNYHGSLENYKDAKKHITKFQTPDDTVFYYAHNEGAKDIASLSPGTKISFGDADAPIAVQDTKLIGTHNLLNIAGAAAVARHVGVSNETIVAAVRTFKPLPHRLQYIGTHEGVHWVDDSISTTPESAIAAIRALSPRVKTIILGGQDRGSTFSELGQVIEACGVEHVITMGESGPKIAEAMPHVVILHTASSMAEAVDIAKGNTKSSDSSIPICLLSPASPSYDQFKSFEEKGAKFKDAIGI